MKERTITTSELAAVKTVPLKKNVCIRLQNLHSLKNEKIQMEVLQGTISLSQDFWVKIHSPPRVNMSRW